MRNQHSGKNSVGQFRYRATFQTPTETADGTGQPIPAWADGDTVWAKYVPEQAVEKEIGGQVRSIVYGLVILLRPKAGITPKDRIKINGYKTTDLILNILTIEQPDPVEGTQTLMVAQPEAGLTL